MKNDHHLSSDSALIFIKQESHSTPVELHFLFSQYLAAFSCPGYEFFHLETPTPTQISLQINHFKAFF